jgi:hypothetical protein
MALPDDMRPIEHLIDDIDNIARAGFNTYQSYPAQFLIEHSSRTAANCRYDHMVADLDRRWLDRDGIMPKEISGLKVWLIGGGAVLRLKMMGEDGSSRNYPTKQTRDFDRGIPLPGLPDPAIRITAGYLLDATQSQFIRTQIAKPRGRGVEWCVAIVPADGTGGVASWVDVTRQKILGT